MDALIKKYRNKLRLEGVIKAAFVAAAIAAAFAAVIAFIVWLSTSGASIVWTAVGIFLGVTAVATPVIYFFKYRATDLELARRLDRLGLSERMVTMLEYTGSLTSAVGASAGAAVVRPGVNSAMLAAQTADAVNALNSLINTKTKVGLVSITASVVVPLAIAFVPFGGMVTVGALADTNVIPTGYEIIREMANPVTEKFYTVNYRAALLDLKSGMYTLDAGGVIDGDDEQLVAYTVNGDDEVLSTSSATPVLAIEEDDYVFLFWDMDTNLTDPYRLDTDLTPIGSNYEYDEDGNIVITHIAFFARLEGGDGDEDGDGKDGESDEQGNGNNGDESDDEKEGDKPQDAPDDESQNSDKKPDDSDSDTSNKNDGDPNNNRGGEYNPDKDNIIDGNQNYRDLYKQYYEEAMAIIASGEELPEYYKRIIEAYFGVIV